MPFDDRVWPKNVISDAAKLHFDKFSLRPDFRIRSNDSCKRSLCSSQVVPHIMMSS